MISNMLNSYTDAFLPYSRDTNSNNGKLNKPVYEIKLIDTNSDCRALNAEVDQYHLQIYKCALNIRSLADRKCTTAAATTTYSSNNTTASAKQFLTNSTYRFNTNQNSLCSMSGDRFSLTSMSFLPHRILQRQDPKPKYSYIGLIAMAILNSNEGKLVLSEIYQYILDNYSYFRNRGSGWRNSIRHNLSLNDCFIKSGRSVSGKGHYWAIHSANIDDFRRGDFRRRKAQRKIRKHMGLTVDGNITDSPSPPLDLTAMKAVYNLTSKSLYQPLTTSTNSRFKQLYFTPHLSEMCGYYSVPSSMAQIFTQRQSCGLNPNHYAINGIIQHPTNQLHIQNESKESHLANNTHDFHDYNHQLHDSLQLEKQILPIANTEVPIDFYAGGNLINDIFIAHKRKRQFDVASLLEPDNLFDQSLQHYQQSHLIMCPSYKYESSLQRQQKEQQNQRQTITPKESRTIVTNEVVANRIHSTINETEIEDIDIDIDVDADVDNKGLYASISNMIRSKAKLELSNKYQIVPNFINSKINAIHCSSPCIQQNNANYCN